MKYRYGYRTTDQAKFEPLKLWENNLFWLQRFFKTDSSTHRLITSVYLKGERRAGVLAQRPEVYRFGGHSEQSERRRRVRSRCGRHLPTHPFLLCLSCSRECKTLLLSLSHTNTRTSHTADVMDFQFKVFRFCVIPIEPIFHWGNLQVKAWFIAYCVMSPCSVFLDKISILAHYSCIIQQCKMILSSFLTSSTQPNSKNLSFRFCRLSCKSWLLIEVQLQDLARRQGI